MAVGARDDAESTLLAHLYASALRTYGTAAHVEVVPDPLAGLDSGDVRWCLASPAGCWTLSRPAPRRVPRPRSTATWCRRCPKASPRATTPKSAEDKPALAVTEATADAWGGRDVTAAVRHCDKLKVGQVAGAARPAAIGTCAATVREYQRPRNAFRRTAGGAGERRVDVDGGSGRPRRRGDAGRPHSADPRGERRAAVPPQRTLRNAGARAQRGGRRAGHRRAGADAPRRWRQAPTRPASPTGSWPIIRWAPPAASAAPSARSPRRSAVDSPTRSHGRGCREPWHRCRPARGPCSCAHRPE